LNSWQLRYPIIFLNKNNEERYSRVPRLSDTRYSAKGKLIYNRQKEAFPTP